MTENGSSRSPSIQKPRLRPGAIADVCISHATDLAAGTSEVTAVKYSRGKIAANYKKSRASPSQDHPTRLTATQGLIIGL